MKVATQLPEEAAAVNAKEEAVMRARMQPISSILTKLPRFVRDLALGAGKEVEIELHGQETDLDKSVLEAIKTSLLHLVRNAVDHGSEPPEQREAAGKPRVGRVVLRAAHEGGAVAIEVKDDGKGLDTETILDRALSVGIVILAFELQRFDVRFNPAVRIGDVRL